ncbi:MAG: Inner membrane ABC transporter permease protein YdcV [Burkholderiaceae bacterium]|nr:Inner membrane ABC transporter permease protein YdcV [Burkholderiaceae bacterium]
MAAAALARPRSRQTPLALSAVVWAISLVLIAPIAILIIVSFSGQAYLKFPPDSFSLRWFETFLRDARWQESIWLSVRIGLIACAFATAIGFFAAYALVRGRFPGKTVVLSVLLTPMIIPSVVTAIAIYFMSAAVGLVGSVLWLGFCHAVVALPVVVLILLSTLNGVDENLERAALSLGASRTRVFTHVVAPLAAPGLASAALFAFLTSFDELLISLFLADVRSQTLPVRIWNSLHLDVEPTIAAVNAFLIAVTGVVLALEAVLRARRNRHSTGRTA